MNRATTSKTTETATCPQTSNAPPHRLRRPKPAASVAFITEVKSARVDRMAGTNPNRTALANATRRLNTNARRSSPKRKAIGKSVGIGTCRNSITPAYPTPRPTTLPSIASTMLSVINCRINRRRPAPIATRSAISRDRAGARLVKSPATLAHATNSTAPARVVNIARNTTRDESAAILACSSVRTDIVRFRFVSGYARSRSLAMTDSSVAASVIVTPGFSRPLMVRFRASRASSGRAFGSGVRRGHIVRGA